MRKILLAGFLFTAMNAFSQDVLTKKNGDEIQVQVLEITNTDVKYKKWSNQGGPTYTLPKSDVFMIKYKNGEKDVFKEQSVPTILQGTINNGITLPADDPALDEKNKELILAFNAVPLQYTGKATTSSADGYFCTLGVKENSNLETQELSVGFEMKQHGVKRTIVKKFIKPDEFCELGVEGRDFLISLKLSNKTDKTLYVDLAKTYVIYNGKSLPYFVPSSTTTTSSKSSGGSLNLGAAANALGIGGRVGTLANGLNVGGTTGSNTSNTVYSQRVISIPPMSYIVLEPKTMTELNRGGDEFLEPYRNYLSSLPIISTKKEFGGKERFCVGEIIDIPDRSDINPLSFVVSYAGDEDCETTKSLRIGLFINRIMGMRFVKYPKLDGCHTDNPLRFWYKKGWIICKDGTFL